MTRFGGVREGQSADAVGQARPRFVVEPASAEAMASLLGWASGERLSVMLRGGGTKIGWGRGADAIDLLVSTSGLNRVLSHEHGVGADKAEYMPKMFTDDDLEAMQKVRRAFDPRNLSNPGKIFPTPRLCGEVPGPYRQHPLEKAGLAERF